METISITVNEETVQTLLNVNEERGISSTQIAGVKISICPKAPFNPSNGDLWIDTSN